MEIRKSEGALFHTYLYPSSLTVRKGSIIITTESPFFFLNQVSRDDSDPMMNWRARQGLVNW